ncbi:MAG: hypothetical protein HQL59_13785 [Magnetococcales bacterium]|nr:hypothetical protein [Magnetococcales bacterium]
MTGQRRRQAIPVDTGGGRRPGRSRAGRMIRRLSFFSLVAVALVFGVSYCSREESPPQGDEASAEAPPVAEVTTSTPEPSSPVGGSGTTRYERLTIPLPAAPAP